MCDPITITTIAGTALTAYGQFQQGQATKAANEFQAEIYNRNAQIANQNAANERQLGLEEARKIRLQTRAKIGQQKAAMAANGIDIYQGTPVDLTADTASMGELDALTSMYNSEMRAINYENKSGDFSSSATMSRMSGRNAFISGGLNALGTGISGLGEAYTGYRVSGRWSGYGNTGLKTT